MSEESTKVDGWKLKVQVDKLSGGELELNAYYVNNERYVDYVINNEILTPAALKELILMLIRAAKEAKVKV